MRRYSPRLPLGTAASSRSNSAADCQRRPGIFFQTPVYDGFQFARTDASALDRGSLARQHFVEDPAERVDISACIRWFAFPLLRRHVGGRAHDHAVRR